MRSFSGHCGVPFSFAASALIAYLKRHCTASESLGIKLRFRRTL